MKFNRTLSLKTQSRNRPESSLSKKQTNYLTKKIQRKLDDLTQSFLSSRTQNPTQTSLSSTLRLRTAVSMSHSNKQKQINFQRPRSKPNSTSYFKNNFRSDIIEAEYFKMSIPLKSTPRDSRRKSSFGWVNFDKDSTREQINIIKSGRGHSILLKRNRNDWKQTLKQVKRLFEQKADKLSILPQEIWGYLVGRFQNFHLNINEKEQLLELFCKFFQRYFVSPKQIIAQFISTYFGIMNIGAQFEFCEEVGTKFHKMQNRIYFKHKYCLQYAKFMATPHLHNERFYPIYFTQFKFDLNQTEVFELFRTVRQFCQNNMDAFAFVTLYFQISIKKLLQKLPYKAVESEYKKVLREVQLKYPASQEEKIINLFTQKFQKSSSSHQYEKFFFVEGHSHFDQLKQFILKKAGQAKQDQNVFRCLVEDICFIHGYSFKSGVKIKSAEHQACIFRTIEKLMDKKKFKSDLQKFKKSRAEINSLNHNISDIIQLEIQQAQQAISEILQGQKYIEFDAKDLVRGKCTFSKVQEIHWTLQNLKSHIDKQGFKLIQIKDRLKKGTKDVSLIIKLQNSIAELQLALKLDSVSNEFNHKIFQLTRSHIHQPIINLFIHNQRWSQTFFTEQFQLFQSMSLVTRQPALRDSVTFKQMKRDISSFKQNYLEAYGIKYEKVFKFKQEERVKVTKKMEQIKKYGKSLTNTSNPTSLKNSQRQNLIYFYKNFDWTIALDQIEQIDEDQIEGNSRLLKLKGEILKLNSKFTDSFKCYQKYRELYCSKKQNILELADVYHTMGSMYGSQKNFQKAIEYYEKSLQIKEAELKGKKDIQIANSLAGIGEILSNMKTKQAYQKALQYHFKALEIRQQFQGKKVKESIDIANSLNNIGVVYRRKYDFQSSLTYLEQSLEMRKRIAGPESLDASASLYNIGVLYFRKNEHKKALQYLSQSIEIIEKIMGRESIELARGYLYVSCALEQLDELEKAEESIMIAHKIFKKVLGEENPDTQFSYQQYMDIRRKMATNLNLSFIGFSKYKKRSSLSLSLETSEDSYSMKFAL